MESNNEFKKLILNRYTFLFWWHNINDLDLDNVLLGEKSYGNISIYDVAYKTLYDAKPLRIIFDKVDGHIKKTILLNI